jgi:hypothetical protein
MARRLGEKVPGERKTIGARAAREFRDRQRWGGERQPAPVLEPAPGLGNRRIARAGVLLSGAVYALFGPADPRLNRSGDHMDTREPSIADVIKSAIRDAQDLVRSEVALAKAEVRQEVRRVSVGAGLLAGAALAAVIAVIFLMTTIALAIADLLDWPVWSGFGMVTVLVAIAAWNRGLHRQAPDYGSPPHAADSGRAQGEHRMDANADFLADTIRAKREAIDQDLKLLRGKLASVDPRRRINARQLARTVLPVVAGTGRVVALENAPPPRPLARSAAESRSR